MNELIQQILEKSKSNQRQMVQFLRDMIAIPSVSTQEKGVVNRIFHEMEIVGMDEVRVDGLGNVIGKVGQGKTIIAFDAHIDTVDVGNPSLWTVDPFHGAYKDGYIYGRGSCDQESGMASMVYAAKIMKELAILGDFTVYFIGSIMEEDCDGLCWQYILEEEGIRPDVVVITEPTNLGVYRGHRGRMEIQIRTSGRSCHASAPERGDNAIYKMVPIIKGIEQLHGQLKEDAFLGKGSIAVTQIFFQSPSQNAVPDECTIQLDRRLTWGETKETVYKELDQVIRNAGVEGEIIDLHYNKPSYLGTVFPTEKYFPTWLFEEEADHIQKAKATYELLFQSKARLGRWDFSTNGVATAGIYQIPTVGFGPGNEIYAHAPDERVLDQQLVDAAAFYTLFPLIFTS